MKERSDLLLRVGTRLRVLREERGLTQEWVAERSGFSPKYISLIERGRRDPPLTTLAGIVEDGIGCELRDVVGQATRKTSARTTGETSPYSTRRLPPAVYELAEQIVDLPRFQARAQVLAMMRSAIALARGKQ